MHPTIWLSADTLTWPRGGGHLWEYLNWALALKGIGCSVVWLECTEPTRPVQEVRALVAQLKQRLAPYGLADSVAVGPRAGSDMPRDATEGCIPLGAAADADLLLNFSYDACAPVMARFRRTAMVDLDPGLTQVWMSDNAFDVPVHDVHFTTGETVGRPGSRFPSAGRTWVHTPPCVALDHWPVAPALESGAFSTVSGWQTRTDWFTYGSASFCNSKREGFMPYLELPAHTRQRVELALCLAADEAMRLAPDQEAERRKLEDRGWGVVHSEAVASTPWDYQSYVRRSRGEFSCAKPSCRRLQNAWVSNRTLCYLASGRPAVVEHTGPSSFLPDAEGMFRFRTIGEAGRALEQVAADYDRHRRSARALAEEHFDGSKVATRLLEHALA